LIVILFYSLDLDKKGNLWVSEVIKNLQSVSRKVL